MTMAKEPKKGLSLGSNSDRLNDFPPNRNSGQHMREISFVLLSTRNEDFSHVPEIPKHLTAIQIDI